MDCTGSKLNALGILSKTIILLSMISIANGCGQNDGSRSDSKTSQGASPVSQSVPVPAPDFRLVAIRKNPKSKMAVIFVHGVFGDENTTWINPKTKSSWPKMLLDDPVFDPFDIYAFGYPTTKFAIGPRIDQIGDGLALRIKAADLNGKSIVFVAHSMGGLVVRACLLRHRNDDISTPLIAFYSTPTDGADLAKLADILSSNPVFKGMSIDNEWLKSQKLDWLAAEFKTRSLAVYETSPYLGRIIVSESSALALANTAVPLPFGHIDIVKPETTDSTPYVALRNAVAKISPPDIQLKKAEHLIEIHLIPEAKQVLNEIIATAPAKVAAVAKGILDSIVIPPPVRLDFKTLYGEREKTKEFSARSFNFAEKIDGKSTLVVIAPRSKVSFSTPPRGFDEGSKIDGESKVFVVARDVTFSAKINNPKTRVYVILTSNGSLTFNDQIGGGALLLWGKGRASDSQIKPLLRLKDSVIDASAIDEVGRDEILKQVQDLGLLDAAETCLLREQLDNLNATLTE